MVVLHFEDKKNYLVEFHFSVLYVFSLILMIFLSSNIDRFLSRKKKKSKLLPELGNHIKRTEKGIILFVFFFFFLFCAFKKIFGKNCRTSYGSLKKKWIYRVFFKFYKILLLCKFVFFTILSTTHKKKL